MRRQHTVARLFLAHLCSLSVTCSWQINKLVHFIWSSFVIQPPQFAQLLPPWAFILTWWLQDCVLPTFCSCLLEIKSIFNVHCIFKNVTRVWTGMCFCVYHCDSESLTFSTEVWKHCRVYLKLTLPYTYRSAAFSCVSEFSYFLPHCC